MSNQEGAFPAGFVWGAATASYQIEGAAQEDGRSESIWDVFCRIPGKVRNNDNGDIADDHYHRYVEDVALMRDLGLDAYRFSTAWPRIIPEGRGTLNEQGLDFYDRLVDELLRNDIQPYLTLYHWDLPQVLEDRGGWTNRETVDAYIEYVDAVSRRLGDRVKNWITHNEPQVVSWAGYAEGVHAPGRTDGFAGFAQASHHLFLSHGKALQVIRQNAPGARVGITLNLTPIYPHTQGEQDRAAAWRVDGTTNRWFLDPIFRGEYPADVLEMIEQSTGQGPPVEPGDLEIISQPIDFLGINNYSRQVVHAGPENRVLHHHPPESEYTDMEWEVYPDGLFDLLVRVGREYAPPRIYITENGAAYPDVRTHDGRVLDPERTSYIERHLDAVRRAIAGGAPVEGYFVWSLLDNFEWGWGYWRRFGIIYVDYPTLERVPKGSYYWYRDFIARQRVSEDVAAAS